MRLLASVADRLTHHHRHELELREAARRRAREAFARDIHDGIIQRLYAVGLELGAAADPHYDASLDQRMAMINNSIGRINNTIADLRDTLTELNDGVIVTSIEVRSIAREYDAEVRHISEGVDELIPAASRRHLVHAARECLSNALRHADATTTAISLATDNQWVTLIVTDDGRGFDRNLVKSGMGLTNLRARAEDLGGSFRVHSATGAGTEIELRVPATRR